MKRIVLAVLLLVLAGVIGGGWYWLGRTPGGGAAQSTVAGPVGPAGPADPTDANSPAEGSPADVELADADETGDSVSPAPSARRELPTSDDEPRHDQSFTGAEEILLPLTFEARGTRDDALTVYAFYETEDDGDASSMAEILASAPNWKALDDIDEDALWVSRRIEVGDTQVSLPVPEGITASAFLVRGRYYASAVHEAPAGGKIEPLEVQLGSWVVGRVILPTGWEEREVDTDDLEVDLSTGGEGSMGLMFGGSERTAEAADDLSFEFHAVLGDSASVACATEGLVDYQKQGIALQPGERVEIDIPFQLGGMASGRVLSDDGSPVGGATVRTGGRMWFMGGNVKTTGADGSYTLSGIKPGKVQIEASADGHTDGKLDSFEIADGEALSGLDITLSRGASVHGIVQWPDGRPAADVKVEVAQEKEGNAFRFWESGNDSTYTDDEGRFRLSGLLPKTCSVTATLFVDADGAPVVKERPEAPTIESVEDLSMLAEFHSGEEPEDGQRWRAQSEAVGDQAAGLVLTLEPPGTITGRVVDDTGEPITEFHVSASPERDPSNPWGFGGGLAESFESDEGLFELENAYIGTWDIDVTAEGFGEMREEVSVVIPHAEPIEIVLSRGAKLTGIVVDPSGNPLFEAEVEAAEAGQRWGSDTAETDEEGRFTFDALNPQSWTLTATHEEWAESEAVAIELLPATTTDEIVLTLRVGGTITGEVFDDDGEPDVGQNITWGKGSEGFNFGGDDDIKTDSNGRFVIERVTPGKITVTATPSQEEMMSMMAEAEDESSFINVMGQMRTTSVEVVDGEEVHVVLGGTPKSPVNVRGIVREAGRAVPQATVLAVSEGGSFIEGMKAGKTDDAGRYEITLDRPGAYVFHVNTAGLGGGSMGIEFYEDIPEASDHSLDLNLPMGRIEGQVLGPDGTPMPGVALRIANEEGVLGIGDIDESSSAESDSEGRFAFEHLWPGTYTLRAGGGRQFFGPRTTGFGAEPFGGIELEEDQLVDGIILQMRASGTLKGTVVDTAGNPVQGASIFVRDGAGRVLANVAFVATDPAGRFTYSDLPAGELFVSARGADLVSAENTAVRILEGGTSEVELTVDAGSFVVVTAQFDGEPVRARLRVLDGNGHELQGMFAMSDLENLFSEGFSSKERRIGPVPPGNYHIFATTRDGREADRKFKVRPGQEERKVKLRLK